MAVAVLTFALETARDLLIEEAKCLYGVRGEVEEIGVELRRMKIFLEYADAKKHEDKMLGNRVAEIRELAEEVAYVLETFAIEVTSKRSSRNDLKRFACIFNECTSLHRVGSEIVNIKTKLTNLTNSLPRYDIPKGETSNSTQERERWDRLSFPHFEEAFVAMEEDISQLVFHLLSNNNEGKQLSQQVVSIWGMGGLGKTSLARKVYYHNEVRQYFDRYAWVCITQRCQPRKILQEILGGLVPEKGKGIVNLTDQQLVEQVYQVQEKNKCLIVIDDIWSINDWNSLRPAFPIGKTHTSSKVLLTTRLKEVALHADPTGFLHEPKGLGEEESWNLLSKKAFPRRDVETGFIIDPRMEKLGREMVRRCGGLPLAVVVLGGILVTKQTSKEWELVLQNIKGYLAKGNGIGQKDRGVSHVLALSYTNLPYHLKSCFLYLANFPADSDIQATRLCHLWVAERIVSSDDRKEGETMMDVAEHYLGELAQRCMVQVRVKDAQRPTRRFKSCRLHDLMRDLCLSKVKEENFPLVIGSGVGNDECSTSLSFDLTETKRLTNHNNDEVGGYKMSLEKPIARHVRSLLIFQGGTDFLWKVSDNINCFKLLRVLDLEETNMWNQKYSLEAIGKLMHLRHFSLKNIRIGKLPSSIGKLRYLETLDLRESEHLFIPNVLWKLQRLRHLYLPTDISFDREKEKKLRLDGLHNLETLVSFDPDFFDIKDLLKLKNLRKLKADVHKEREHLTHLETVTTSTNSLLQQSHLSILDYSFHSEEELSILKKLLRCHHLIKLFLQGHIGNLQHCHFSPSLTKLTLWDSKLEDDPMPTLGKLPSLIYLYIGRDVFMGQEMVCSSTDFLQLINLRFGGLLNLANWTVDQGAFPKLSHFSMSGCYKLKMIPDGFAFLAAMKELTIVDMPQEFINRLQVVNGKEGEDYHKVQHIPSICIPGAGLR